MNNNVKFSFVLLMSIINWIFAQNSAPVVQNVTFTPRTDGSYFVDIYYDLYDCWSNHRINCWKNKTKKNGCLTIQATK